MRKKIIFYCMIQCLFFLTGLQAQKTTVFGKVKFEGAPIYNQLIINSISGNRIIPVDTVEISKKGEYRVTLEIKEPSLFAVQFMPSKEEITYWILEPNTQIGLDYTVGIYPVLSHVQSSKNMMVYKKFIEANAPIELLNREYAGATEERQKELITEFKRLFPDVQSAIKNLILENKDMLISAFLVTCFDQDFASHISVYEEVRNALLPLYPNDPFVKNIDTKIKQSLSQGVLAPDIVMNSPEDKELKLSDLRGNVVLIDFWASWCGPCRRENPNVVRLYKKYHPEGFEVFSVSLDKDKNSWIKAIADDGLIWPYHVSDLKYWNSEAGKLYGISSIPATILIDNQGRVIAKNLRGAELENKLKEIFEK